MRRSIARAPTETDPDTAAATMDSLKLQFRPSPRSTNLFSRSPNKQPKSNALLLTSIVLALAIVFYLFVTSSKSPSKRKFGIVIDGGSTGTRIHVFEYGIKDGAPVFDFGPGGLVSKRVTPGLSVYVDDPEGAGRAVWELVEFGRGRVPRECWGRTEIRLMATAGLRLVEDGARERILEQCRRVLRGSGFVFRDDWASVISGSDEGLYAWVVANYALGTLGAHPQQTTGIIELGGASAQVTFVSSEPIPPEFSRTVKFGNFSYNLYSHSLLQFGQNVAHELLRESLIAGGKILATKSLQMGKPMDPCTPRGYTHDMGLQKLSPSSLNEKNRYLAALLPNGNFSECRSASLMLLQNGKEECSYKHCSLGSTFIPSLQGKFLATENFFYTSKFFRLSPRASLSDLTMAGENFCQEDWAKLKRKYASFDEEDLPRYCFSSAYIVALLHDSLGIALNDKRIGFANQVNEIPLDWALGAFILHSTAGLDAQHSNWITSIFGDDTSTLLVFLVFSVALTLTAWSVSKWRKPQLKTIYDLEKGKYIVTRVGRCS
ncbi:hypothetical protein RJ640_007873 [Escallonia rubra]|uniref:Apyrase 6 n=1 Tax=Escallonia rubra TaxID=112253 RepID=A0AA88QLQ6_9ASTE|nr:hypothetical protein RJ640_007873 [Escallonia rubra]